MENQTARVVVQGHSGGEGQAREDFSHSFQDPGEGWGVGATFLDIDAKSLDISKELTDVAVLRLRPLTSHIDLSWVLRLAGWSPGTVPACKG